MKGVCTITSRFQCGVFILCLANVTLSVREQLIRLVLIFILGSYVSIQSQYSVHTEDTLPKLGGTILVAMVLILFFHTFVVNDDGNGGPDRSSGVLIFRGSSILRFHIQREEFIVHSVRLMLTIIYAHHTFTLLMNVLVYKINSDDILDQLMGFMKVASIAAVGSVATGVFKTNIDQKEQLEVLVRERTKVIRLKTKELGRINIAFEACETAIAITDFSRVVIWTNHAFEELAKRMRKAHLPLGECFHAFAASDIGVLNETCSSVGRQLMDAIVLNDSFNETKLRGAFDFLSPRHDEICIIADDCTHYREKNDYSVEVTPFVDSDGIDGEFCINNNTDHGIVRDNDSKLFLVAFHDITAN